MTKRTLALCLALVLSFVFVGCNGAVTVTPTDVTQTDVSKLDTSTGEADEVSTSASEVETSSEVSTSSQVAASSEPAKEAAASQVKKPAASKVEKPSNTVSSKPAKNENKGNASSEDEDQMLVVEHDMEEIEKAIAKYINEYRVAEGNPAATFLFGKARDYVKIRAKQLTTNYAHDADDERAAATQLEFGEYTVIDPADCNNPAAIEELKKLGLWTDEVTTYWEPVGGEAIGKGEPPFYFSNDEIGEYFAKAFYDSKGHWRYLGHESNVFITVGVVKHTNGVFYCDVYVNKTNEYD